MIDVTEQISNVRRTLGDKTVEAGGARVLTISQVYDTDLDDMWDVVSNPERIARWFLPISGDLHEGGKYQFEGQAGGTITRCDKPRSVAATWEFGGQVSWVEVRLTPAGDGRTRFELEHTAPIDDHWDQFGPGAVGIGWDMAVWGLANHLAHPDAPIDKDQAMAWMLSADGRQFMKLSSDAWAAADLALGTDPDDVTRRAAATYAAYTATE
ncbi:activator of HSP90 ATPase [Actinoplanes ianthinogenes]|uniref:Activator of HSP90 ATPase n=1 Tax=Actinoplanes ianthinogenes TaxID=122358 RepID=A0ABM7LM05_9ACTN|nr:SRPBCC family protein [Actinoplanes ianthinogenes]BCJ40275.1 activator of HSP90 ATPase [Actinoplanes ianthinogenes]GGR11309.1 activator of HSP90 ATPase [Actinoplanes ianthinogenes]